MDLVHKALCSLYSSPPNIQFPDSPMEPSEYTTALTKPLFICQLPNENLMAEFTLLKLILN